MTTRTSTLTGMIFLAAAARLVPHPPNVAPVAAMALFGGARFRDRRAAFLVPLAAMLASDLFLGFHALMPFVYGSFAAIVGLGFWLRGRRGALPVAGAALAGSLLFFAVTNLGVWALGSFYARTPAGLAACYAAALPFLRNTLAGDAFYAAVLFGTFAAAERGFPALREAAPAAL